MQIRGVTIRDTFAEAFGMTATRVIVTAATAEWAEIAGRTATGYACSVIGCDSEAGIERRILPESSPDGRPGVSLLFFAFGRDALEKAVVNRVGQCVLTCATSACYNGLPTSEGKTIRVGGRLRYFGDGFQISKKLDDQRYWRIPVMDGEFLCEDHFGTIKGVAGGNLIICGETQHATLAAAVCATSAIADLRDVILPFPGGVVRSGSKVGSKYPSLRASTNQLFCPTLRGLVVNSELPDGANAALEIVIDGLSTEAVAQAMKVGIDAACQPGIVAITAGNYGGKLGPHQLHLHQLFME